MKPEELTDLLAAHYLAQRKSWKREGRLYMSDLGDEGCALSKWRTLKDYPQKPKTPGELLMFKQGDNLEEQVADDLASILADKTDWALVDRQTSVSITVDGEEITGKLDILMRNVVSAELLVLEVKSKRGRAFSFLPEAKRPNICQTRGYQDGTGATKGILVYVDREGQNFMRAFAVEPDHDDLFAEARKLQAMRDGPAPDCMKLGYKRNSNKGADSFSLTMPWQVNWCNDLECPCKKSMPSFPDGKVIAKEGPTGLVATDKQYDTLIPVLMDLLK